MKAFILCGVVLLVSFASFSKTQTKEMKGRAIAEKMDKAVEGFVGESMKGQMILIDAHGSQIEREMLGKTRERKKEGNQSLSIFLKPYDVKGTKLLTWSYKDREDDQWLYLPSLKRVKRITSQAKSSSFMGSEFTYEDLGDQEIDKYRFSFLREEKFEGLH